MSFNLSDFVESAGESTSVDSVNDDAHTPSETVPVVDSDVFNDDSPALPDDSGVHPLDRVLMGSPVPDAPSVVPDAPSSLADFQVLLDEAFNLAPHVSTIVSNNDVLDAVDSSFSDGVQVGVQLPSERPVSDFAWNVDDSSRWGFDDLVDDDSVLDSQAGLSDGSWVSDLYQRALAPSNEGRDDVHVMGEDEEFEFYERRARDLEVSRVSDGDSYARQVKEGTFDFETKVHPFSLTEDGRLVVNRSRNSRTQPVVTEESFVSDADGVVDKRGRVLSGSERNSSGKLSKAQLHSMMLALKDAGQEYVETDATSVLKKGRSTALARSKARKVGEFLWAQTVDGMEGMRNGGHQFSAKDMIVLDFLCRFKFVSTPALSTLYGLSKRKTTERLKWLSSQGLVRYIVGASPIPLWGPTSSAMVACGLTLNVVPESKIVLPTQHHQQGVNHVASCLVAGVGNPLNLPDFPLKNRVGLSGRKLFGEKVVSEFEIRSSFGFVKGFGTGGDKYRPVVLERATREWDSWFASDDPDQPSPEMVGGNEWMWTVVPPQWKRTAQHYPDLVCKRDRSEDGSANSIAVEVELSPKTEDAYATVLRTYLEDDRLYRKVVYVTGNNVIANMIERVGLRCGLIQQGRLDIVPLLSRGNEIIPSSRVWEL